MSEETIWTERAPGSVVAQGTDDPSILILGAVGDWVRTPPGLPDIGPGVKLKVLGTFAAPCPMCDREHRGRNENVRHITLERDYRVAECVTPGHGFVWYQ